MHACCSRPRLPPISDPQPHLRLAEAAEGPCPGPALEVPQVGPPDSCMTNTADPRPALACRRLQPPFTDTRVLFELAGIKTPRSNCSIWSSCQIYRRRQQSDPESLVSGKHNSRQHHSKQLCRTSTILVSNHQIFPQIHICRKAQRIRNTAELGRS